MWKSVSALGVGFCVIFAAQNAFALLVPLRSAKNVPFQVTYPKSARMQVYSALEPDHCKFLKGQSFNWLSQLQFQGNTDALNEMLTGLASCPGTTVKVSFEDSREAIDWRIDYDCRSMTFQAIVNLKSANIALDRLAIPAARGPQVESASVTPM